MEIIKSNSKFLSVQPPVMEASKINIKLLFQHKYIVDKKGNLYNIEDNKLIKIGLKNFSNHLNDIINRWKDYTIIFNIYSVDDFNKLSSLLKEIPNRENDIIIDLSTLENLNKEDYLDFKNLPEYVYVTTHTLNYPLLQEKEEPVDNNNSSNFSTWALWLDDKDLGCVMNNLLPSCKRHILSERVIAKQFYSKFAISGLLDSNKIMHMYNWCNNNIKNADNTNDSVLTYRSRMGSATGKAKLLKLLLNNQYTKIDCDIEYGLLNGVEHAWNIIKLDDITYRIDTTNGNIFTNLDELNDNGYEFISNQDDNLSIKRIIG